MPSQIRIYDNGGKTVDRYTLVVPSVNEPGKLDMYGFNDAPYHPQGFGQYAGAYPRTGSYSHLGKLVSLSDLPEQARRFVEETLTTPLPDGYGIPLPKSWPGKKKAAPRSRAKTSRPYTRNTQPIVGGIRGR